MARWRRTARSPGATKDGSASPCEGARRFGLGIAFPSARVACSSRISPRSAMFQVTFSEQSLGELRKLPTLEQLEVIDPLGKLTEAQLAHPREPLGSFSRDGKTMYRLRSGEYRIYFERAGELLVTRCILPKNTLTDFVFRTK